jgi:hypothetical protein
MTIKQVDFVNMAMPCSLPTSDNARINEGKQK